MSYFSKFTKLAVVPIKKCLSFDKDPCFTKAKQTFIDTGLKWMDLISSKSASVNGYEFIAPNMDSVFFHDDRFEILIDVRGFKPEEIRCKITPETVEVVAERKERMEPTSRTISLARSYHLPQKVTPYHGNCCLSFEGILLITAPWNR